VTAGAWAFLVWRGLAAQPGRALVLVLCTALSCALGGLAVGALGYLHREVRPELANLFPENRLVVRPPDLDISVLKLQLGAITDQTVAEVAAMPGVTAVHPQLAAEFPLMAEARIGRLDAEFASDVVLLGVPRALIEKDLPPAESFTWDPNSGQPVPVAISAYFLDLYNLGLAEGAGLPKLSRQAAIGRELELWLGESTLGFSASKPARRVKARVVGLTTNPLLVGLAAPIDAVRGWNAHFGGRATTRYGVLHVDVASPMEAAAVRDAVASKGFRVDSTADDLRRFQEMLRTVQGLLGGAVVLVVLLAGVGIVSTVLMATRERRAQWGLARATGLAPGGVVGLVLAESLVMVAVSAVAGFGLVAGVLALLRGAFGELVANLSVLPGDPFALTTVHGAAVAALAAALLVLPGVLFTLPAAWGEPIRLLSRRSL
jgi:hypothetical protein